MTTHPTSCGHSPVTSAAIRHKMICISRLLGSLVKARGWMASHPNPVPPGNVMHAASSMLMVKSGIWLSTTAGQFGCFRGCPVSHCTPQASRCSSTSLCDPMGDLAEFTTWVVGAAACRVIDASSHASSSSPSIAVSPLLRLGIHPVAVLDILC